MSKDASEVRRAVMQWEEKWKATMTELGGDVKIPDLWRMSGDRREPQDEGGVALDQQDRASARRTERDARADGGGLREWQRIRRGGW